MRAERLFRSPQLFRRNRPKIPAQGQTTLHAPPMTPPVFTPAQPRCPPFLRQKGAFLPPTPAVPVPEGCPNALFCPGAARLLPGAPRKKPRLGPEKAPAARPEARRAHSPGTPEAPACAAFCLACARPCAARRPKSPAAAESPARQARRPARCHRPPPEGQSARPAKAQLWGKATPTAVVGFFASPWRSMLPQGGIRSLGMTGKRPPPPLA